ncbi:nucleotidyltransferase domain-containing protein [Cupriavidus alkaliphilus]|uniref:nucleotidyltransferase domain-containing protein n=1 Tax=Cupriavidus alkaliphilus TaxID=942866 RepID=UPI00339D6674
MSYIQEARQFSTKQLRSFREIFAESVAPNYSILVVGSLARLEASEESDVDYYCFGDDEAAVAEAGRVLIERQADIARINPNAPSSTGAFGKEGETLEALVSNIGGDDDLNSKITRRILSLLEGAYIASEDAFKRYRAALLDRYVPSGISDAQLCRFLLNDIIRYYRTICVDFEFKTTENKKPWGIRYVKLRFSRKLLYFSGLLAVAETAGKPRHDKIERLEELFAMPPIERVQSICGTARTELALKLYEEFLESISDEKRREELTKVEKDSAMESAIFMELQKKGRVFSEELAGLLTTTYDTSHPIHQAIIF